MAKKVEWGIENVHYATLSVSSTGSVSYGTPVAIPGAVTLTLSPEGEKIVVKADNKNYVTKNVNNGYSGSLEVARIPDSFKESILKMSKDANGVLVENVDDMPVPFALLFEKNGDDGTPIKYAFYNVETARPAVGAKTKASDADTNTLDITCNPAEDTGDTFAMMSDSVSTTASAGWYNAVYIKPAP